MESNTKLNDYQQFLLDSPIKMSKSKQFIIRAIQSLAVWTLIVGLNYQIQGDLPSILNHWLNFAIVSFTIYVAVGLFFLSLIKIALMVLEIPLKVEKDQEKLVAVYNAIKMMASTGLAHSTDLTPYRVFDHFSDCVLFCMLISANYLTLGSIFATSVVFQWIIVYSNKRALIKLLSKLPDPLQKDGESPNIDQLMDDLISGKSD